MGGEVSAEAAELRKSLEVAKRVIRDLQVIVNKLRAQ